MYNLQRKEATVVSSHIRFECYYKCDSRSNQSIRSSRLIKKWISQLGASNANSSVWSRDNLLADVPNVHIWLLIVEKMYRKAYPLSRCIVTDPMCSFLWSCKLVSLTAKKRACQQSGLPLLFRVLLLSHDTAMAVQQLPKTLPSRFLFMFHNHHSGRGTDLNW